MNHHDLELFLDCFDPQYHSVQPLHPDRSFTGREQVRRNWTYALGPASDFRADLLATAVNEDDVWTEWRWTGTRSDGTVRDQRGVVIYRLASDRIVSGRLYMADVAE
jgi:ketosteroid isomerase-like protein